ncbi:MAG: T9SS type A sorting domain-containing protein [Bacteroidota bacterium]|nr:T9SS type A sorting domain-containing protein [Bacteroidota bacterium]MDP4231177.1 T9SS type A sorting domain-containing protein [Bacteroidota bacterium]
MFFASTGFSQSAEKIFSIGNPYGTALRVESLTIDDTANFRIESLKALPCNLGESDKLDFRVTIIPRDGITRTAQVRAGNLSLYTVTMSAPLESSVKSGEDQVQPAYPNPVKDFCTINTDISLYPNVQVEVFNSVGASVIGLIQPVGHGLSLDARNLASGRYHILISSDGTVIRSEDIIVKH